MDGATSWVITMSIVFGSIVLYPVARGLGTYLGSLADRRGKVPPAPPTPELQAELDRTRDELERTRTELDALAERQQFLEALVTSDPVRAVPAGTGTHPGS